ncbi:MAG TPA: sugar ABC transporter permease [Candidatus Ruthenibacterium merdavium]|uniref:Sugar ABC transporter permease n=1 Tax=Candidatus Ruthenibacterium merdavium TaxID=2838752 RepID=A0A9D2Q513_9FIRM|nr:sugar ABC transporter permease [Candidatus Ruthenibacterium merdavium]
MQNSKKPRTNIWPYLLVAPALLVVLCVVFVPVCNAILMSMQNYDLRKPSQIGFIGLGNYIKAFQDELFWSSLWRTILWVVFGVGFQFILGFILALLLNKSFKGRGLARAVSLVPWVTPGVLIGLMWRWMYDGNYGVINDLLQKLHLISEPIPFLAQPETSFFSVILTIVWQGVPFFALMLMAGLQGIWLDLYEAADIDGASWWQKLTRITIPSLKNTIFVTTLLRIIWVANSVDVIFNMTGGGPAYSTQTLSVYVYNRATALDLGYASAISIVLTLLLCLVSVPYLKQMLKKN